MVGLHDIKDSGISVAVAVGGLREISIGIMTDITDMGKGNPVTVGADNVGHVVFRIGSERS